MTSLADVAKEGFSGFIPLGCFPVESPSPAVHLAEALRRRVEELAAQVGTLKACCIRAEAERDELRLRFEAMKLERDVAVALRVGLEEQVAYWKGKAEPLELYFRE